MIMMTGAGSGLMLTPAYSVIGRLLPESRGLGTAALSSLYNVGGFVGPVVTSALIAANWRTPFAVMGASAGVIAALMALAFKTPARPLITGDQAVDTASRLGLLRERNVLVTGAAMFMADLAFLSFASWTPTFMRRQLSMPAELVGFSFGLAIAIGAVGVVAMGYVFDRAGGRRTIAVAGTLSAMLTLLFFIQPSGSPLAMAILVAAGFVTNTFWSLLSALAQVGVSEKHLGTVTGLIQNIGFVGAVVGPTIAGSIATMTEISVALIMTVSIPFALYACLMLLYKDQR
jgi:MFS family permease